jgi:hypothetical protein
MSYAVEREVDYLTGSNSHFHLKIVEHEGQGAIVKEAGYGLGQDKLVTFAAASIQYRKVLREKGVKVPDNYYTRIYENRLLTLDQQIEGMSLGNILKGGSENASEAWSAYVDLVVSLHERNNRSRAMLDTKPGNFVYTPGASLYFVDFFPPPLRAEDGSIYPFDEEVYKGRGQLLWTFNFGDTRGQLTRSLALVRLGTSEGLFSQIKQITIDEIDGQLPSDTVEYVEEQAEKGFPDMSRFYSGEDSEPRLKELLEVS